MASETRLQFAPFSSCVNPSFWSVFSDKKLNDLGLDESHVSAVGSYSINDPPGLPASLNLGWDALEPTVDLDPFSFPSFGTIINLNTLEGFKGAEKNAILEEQGAKIGAIIESGEALSHPQYLNRFVLLMHADLKKYLFYYWFAFPGLTLPGEIVQLKAPKRISEEFSKEEVVQISQAFFSEGKDSSSEKCGCFALIKESDGLELVPLKAVVEEGKDFMLCYADPWSKEGNPGWPLRNILALLHKSAPKTLSRLKVLAIKSTSTKVIGSSVVFELSMREDAKGETKPRASVSGWERNDKGQLGPRLSNMRAQMDPRALAESSVNLNLRLMKWRLAPQLDLDLLSRTRCLLLGSGTLGCNVARCLLGWGVTHVTFVDNGRVSYSNPARQSLFEYRDCLDGGRPKAAAAADSFKRVFPGANADGVELRVPMPGYQMSESFEKEVEQSFDQLVDLVKRHDVIFLLMDTRESRWLPTVLGILHDKLVINAALGFDSYLVMRHGTRAAGASGDSSPACPSVVPGSCLGCYFCNDVVAPGNSTRERTLDQQCTVTRPGVSYQAAAVAVELMASVLQHPEGKNAPAACSKSVSVSEESSLEGVLGLVPHSVRGSVHTFTQFLPTTPAFANCTACSGAVVGALRAAGFDLIRRAANQPGYLEELSGLAGLVSDAAIDGIEEIDDDDDWSI